MSERQINKSLEDTEKQGRGPNIPDDWKRYILEQALTEVKKPRMLLADEILEQMKQSRDVGDKLPERESIAKLISWARNHPHSDLDAPWSLGCLAKNDISPDALPIVMKIYQQKLREDEPHFTIREALWIARLHKVIDDPIILALFASAYALRDQIDEILGLPVYTRGFDITVLSYLDKELTRAGIAKSPGILFYPFETNEEVEELTNKMKQKGYEIITPGEKLLKQSGAKLWQQVVQVTEQARAELEQKKPEELTEERARYLKWAQRFTNAEREKRRAQNER